jgi:hypothetical protein|tara:strand:+ start:376 stop:561 length:186 start_codon:yes stop_codon:yes gene_type:complete
MGKMKEVFMRQQEELDDFEKYYSEMYKIAQYMGTEEMFKTLYKVSSEKKTNNKLKKEKNVR